MAQAQAAVDWSQKLGRTLDYATLNSQLASAKTALSGKDYATARSLADQVLAATTITVDGCPADWQGISPRSTASQGGVSVDAAGVDLKSLSAVVDSQNLYLLVQVYDPPITLQPESVSGGFRYPQFLLTCRPAMVAPIISAHTCLITGRSTYTIRKARPPSSVPIIQLPRVRPLS